MKGHMLCIALTLACASAVAQEEPATVYRQYATQQYMKQLMAKHPEMVEARSAIDRQTFEFSRNGMPDTPTIQVVFHLIGEAASSITEWDVQAQVDALNRDFNQPRFSESETAHPAWEAEGFKDRAAKPSIQFCVAGKDPTGLPTSGVVYANSTVNSFSVGTEITKPEEGGATAWDTDKYLNVWVAPLKEGKAGYAQMPGGPKESDGIVLDVSYFARKDKETFLAANPLTVNYSMGRALSHLVGSYLNLYELWNDEQPCADDNVADTPVHNAPNYDKPRYRHISTCYDNPVEMTMNIMDNSDDEAQYMFTNGQMMRMYAALEPGNGARSGVRAEGLNCGTLPGNSGGEATGNRDSTEPADEQALQPLGIQVFPNPTNAGFTVVLTAPCEETISLLAFNDLGSQKHSQLLDGMQVGAANAVYIDTSSWPSGLYLVQARCGKETASAKLLIER